MELQQRIEMIDTLLEDAGQKMQALDHALAATDVTQEPSENPETKMINAERHKPGQQIVYISAEISDCVGSV